MWRIVALCWVFTAPVLTGILIVAVLMTPLSSDAARWIPIAAVLGFAYSVPCAKCIARFVQGPTTNDAALRWGWGLPARSDRSPDAFSRGRPVLASGIFDAGQEFSV